MSACGTVSTAVLTVGGLGTGSVPAWMAKPNGLLPIMDKPLIHCAVEEALRAGVRQIIFVTHRDDASEVASTFALEKRGETLAELRGFFPPDVTYRFVRQSGSLGLGHAIGCARGLVAEEPFLVIVPDERRCSGTGRGAARRSVRPFRADHRGRRPG